jgi:hypothetical protein
MPQPLPGAISSAIIPDPRPMPLAAFGVGRARVAVITGPVAALQGSLVFPDVFAYGYLIPVNLGWDTRGARGGRVTRYLRGLEDVDQRRG